VISNHPEHATVAEHFGVDFHHLPVSPATRSAQEGAALELLDSYRVDLVVLARYMQVLSAGFVDRYPGGSSTSITPSCPRSWGPAPTTRRTSEGSRSSGVTAHYVTAELDAGPIIDQDVVAVSHRDRVEDLVRKGRDLEKVVLARAVLAHLERRVLIYGHKTVVFP
jgi:formyltetrahydrofolate deformylase